MANNAFDAALAEQLQQLLSRIDSGISTSRNMLSEGESAVGNGSVLSADHVLQVMSGNGQWLQQFEKQIEQQFQGLGDRILAQWMGTTDREIRNSLKELTEMAISLFQEEQQASLSLTEVEDVFQSGGGISRRLQGLVARSATGFLKDLFTSTKTRRNESQRSQDESTRFKSSRGQVQSELSRELARGQRYQ